MLVSNSSVPHLSLLHSTEKPMAEETTTIVNSRSEDHQALTERLAAILQEEKLLDVSYSVQTEKLPAFPALKKEQNEFLRTLLNQEHKKTVTYPIQSSISFTLNEMFLELKKAHPEFEIFIFGSTLNALFQKGNFLIHIVSSLKLSKYENEIYQQFTKPPSDLDICLSLPEETSTEEILKFQDAVQAFFQNKITDTAKNGKSGIFDDKVTPQYPSNFALLGVTTDNGFKIDFNIKTRKSRTINADSLVLMVKSGKSDFEYSLESKMCSEWQAFTEKLLKIVRYDVPSEKIELSLFYMSRKYLEGFRCRDLQSERTGIEKTFHQNGGQTRLIDRIVIRKFEKVLKEDANKGFLLLLQGFIIFERYKDKYDISSLYALLKNCKTLVDPFLEEIRNILMTDPQSHSQLISSLQFAALDVLANGERSSIKNVAWVTHEHAPHFQISIGNHFLMIPIDPQLSKYQDISTLNRLFPGWDIQSTFFGEAGQTLHFILKEYSSIQVNLLTSLVHLLTYEQFQEMVSVIKPFLIIPEVHGCFSKMEERFTTESPAMMTWMQILAESENSSHKCNAVKLWEENGVAIAANTKLSPSIEKFLETLSKERLDLCLKAVQLVNSLDFADKYLPLHTERKQELVSWIRDNGLLKPKSLDHGKEILSSKLFDFVFKTDREFALHVLKDIVNKVQKNEKNLVEFAISMMEKDTEQGLIGAMLLYYLVEKSNTPLYQRVIQQGDKIHQIFSKYSEPTHILTFWKWVQRCKSEFSTLDSVSVQIFAQAFASKVRESQKDAAETAKLSPCLFKVIEKGKMGSICLDQTKIVIDSLHKHKLYKELFQWIHFEIEQIEILEDLERKQQLISERISFLQQLISDESTDKNLADQAIKCLSDLAEKTPSQLRAIASCYMELFCHPHLPLSYKEDVFKSIQQKKRAPLFQAFTQNVFENPSKGSAIYKGFVKNSKQRINPEVLQLVFPLLAHLDEKDLNEWREIIDSYLQSKPSENIKPLLEQYSPFIIERSQEISKKFVLSFLKYHIQIGFLDLEYTEYVLPVVSQHIASLLPLEALEVLEYLDFQEKCDARTRAFFVFQNLVDHICTEENKSKEKQIFPRAQSLLMKHIGAIKENPRLAAHAKKYIEYWGVAYHEEMTQLSEILNIGYSQDSASIEAYKNERERDKANLEWDTLVQVGKIQNLEALNPYLPHISSTKLVRMIENHLKMPLTPNDINQMFLFLKGMDSFNREAWSCFYTASSEYLQTLSSIKELSQYEFSQRPWAFFKERICPHLAINDNSTEKVVENVSLLWLLAAKTAFNCADKTMVDELLDYQALFDLFNHPHFPKSLILHFPSYFLTKLALYLPIDESLRSLSIYLCWRKFADEIVIFWKEKAQHVSEKEGIEAYHTLSIGAMVAVARSGSNDEFKSLEVKFKDVIDTSFNRDTEKTSYNDADKLLQALINIITAVKTTRRMQVVQWCCEYLYPYIKDTDYILKFVDFIISPQTLNYSDSSIKKLLLSLDDRTAMDSKLSELVKVKIIDVISYYFELPITDWPNDYFELFFSLADSYISRRSLQHVIWNKTHKISAYNWLKDPKVFELLSKIKSNINQSLFIIYFNFKGLQAAFSDARSLANKVDIPFIENYLAILKMDIEWVRQLPDYALIIMLREFSLYPIPYEYEDRPWANKVRDFVLFLHGEAIRRDLLSTRKILAFQVSHGLNLPEHQPLNLTAEEYYISIFVLLKSKIFPKIFNPDTAKMALALLGLPIERENAWMFYDEIIRVLAPGHSQYFVLLGEFIDTWNKTSYYFPNSGPYYTTAVCRYLICIGEDPNKLEQAKEVMRRIKSHLEKDDFYILFDNISRHISEDYLLKDRDIPIEQVRSNIISLLGSLNVSLKVIKLFKNPSLTHTS